MHGAVTSHPEEKTTTNEALLIHLNINSLQNKVDELKGINDQLRAHVILFLRPKLISHIRKTNSSYVGITCIVETEKREVAGL